MNEVLITLNASDSYTRGFSVLIILHQIDLLDLELSKIRKLMLLVDWIALDRLKWEPDGIKSEGE